MQGNPAKIAKFERLSNKPLEINGLSISVEYKPIKNMHLAVYPPDGRVHVSAPESYSEERIRLYVLQKWVWLTEKREKLQSFNLQPERQFISGEAHFFKGQLYRLRVILTDASSMHAETSGDYILLYDHPGATREHKAMVLNEWYRDQLKPVLTKLIEKWEKILEVQLAEWEIRDMDSSWGTCSKAKKKALFNLQLAKKPTKCIEYVVAHELTHLIEQKHNDRFKRILDTYLPDWESIRKELNEFPL